MRGESLCSGGPAPTGRRWRRDCRRVAHKCGVLHTLALHGDSVKHRPHVSFPRQPICRISSIARGRQFNSEFVSIIAQFMDGTELGRIFRQAGCFFKATHLYSQLLKKANGGATRYIKVLCVVWRLKKKTCSSGIGEPLKHLYKVFLFILILLWNMILNNT